MLSVIAANAIWLAVDTDYNDDEVLIQAHWFFQFMEHAFCTVFTFEFVVRFMAFKVKTECIYDTWFIFDSVLVLLMIFETWIMTIIFLVMSGEGGAPVGDMSILRIARLMRLTRMA